MPLRTDLLTPIPGENPAGTSLRYDSIYDRIKDARKDDPLHDPPIKADWRQIIDLSSEAIAKRSKDLQLAAWLTEAALRREGVSGLRQGLELMLGLLVQFWDHVYPELDDGDAEMRAAPLGFIGAYLDGPVRLAPLNSKGHSLLQYRESQGVPSEEEAQADDAKREKREAAVAEKERLKSEGFGDKILPEEFEAGFGATNKQWYKDLIREVDGSSELIGKLEKFANERFRDASPSWQKLKDALRDVRVTAVALLNRKLVLDPDPPEEEPITVGPDGEQTGMVSAEPRSRDDAARRIAAAARYLRADTPTDPAPYLLLRGFRWGELRVGGNGLNPRLLAAPPTEVRTRLKGLLLDGKWQDLLEAAEDIMATPYGRGWLDLQRYVLTACEGLGASHAAVSEAIRGALRSLLQDVPELVDATLMDDSPTANVETRGWLHAQGVFAAADGGLPARRTEEAPLAGTLESTVARLAGSQPEKAVDMLMRAAAQEKSERASFLRRSEAARIMVGAGREQVAMPILMEILEQIDKHGLEDWEAGETIAQPLGLLYRCMEKLDHDPAVRQNLYLRVCRLDPLQAMNFESPGSTAETSDVES
jgi:type VI secretion system protein ImpA